MKKWSWQWTFEESKIKCQKKGQQTDFKMQVQNHCCQTSKLKNQKKERGSAEKNLNGLNIQYSKCFKIKQHPKF